MNRICVEHQAQAMWQSPQASKGLKGGWFCGLTYGPLVEDSEANLTHKEER